MSKLLPAISFLATTGFIVLGTIVLVAVGSGYSYDFKTHRQTRNGLVIVGSQPSNAIIHLNSKDIRRKTPYRATLEEGQYTLDISRDGYAGWTKKVDIVTSNVSWLQYVWLLPQQLKDTIAISSAEISQLTTSRDHKHLAFVDTSGVWIMDEASRITSKLFANTPVADKTASRTALEAPVQSVQSIVAWSDDASRLLIIASIADKPHYLLINVADNTTQDLTNIFKFDLSQLRFYPGKNNELYWLSSEGLRRLDISAQTVSAVLADDIISYDFGGDRLLFVQKTSLGRSLYSSDHQGKDKKELVQGLVDSPSYDIAYASYKGQDIMAVIANSSKTLTLYSDFNSNNLVAKTIAKNVNHVVINSDGRFIAYYSSDNGHVYDLEKSQDYDLGNGKNTMSVVYAADPTFTDGLLALVSLLW